MKTKLNGINIHTKGDKKNKAIIFVHGFPFDMTMWNDVVAQLKNDFYCVMFDVRGLGKSKTGDGQYTMEAFTEDIYNIVDVLKLEKPLLCGMSMGGYIILRTAEKEEDKFGGLILCDTRAEADDDAGRLVRAAKIKQVNEKGVKTFVKDFIPPLFGNKTIKENDKLVLKTVNKYKQNDPVGVKGCLLAMLGRTDTNSFFEKTNLPSLVICGEDDKLTPPAYMENLSKKNSGSTFLKVKGAGHLTPIEQPEVVANAVIKKFK